MERTGNTDFKIPDTQYWYDPAFLRKRVMEQEEYLYQLDRRLEQGEIGDFRHFTLKNSATYVRNNFAIRLEELEKGIWGKPDGRLLMKYSRERVYPESFLIWYSGMAVSKIRRAFDRFTIEVLGKTPPHDKMPI